MSRVYRKTNGSSFYVECPYEVYSIINYFNLKETASSIINDFNSNNLKINIKNFENLELDIVDYAFNKSKKYNKQNAQQFIDLSQQISSNNNLDNEPLDYNKLWEVYFDDKYQQNYYFNRFTNQSVWELPEGAAISPYQNNLFVQTEVKVANDNSKNTEQIQEVEELQQEDNYYDEEAWDENDLREKIIWDKLKSQQLKDWLKRPARQQVTDTRRDLAYIEGNYDYNIWFDKYLTDRKEEREKIPALHKCNPALDTGFTKADTQEKEGASYFCLFYAKGCCSEAVNCKYYHRVPTIEECEKIENLRDVFGRSRFATARTDNSGVGTFSRECRTLFVSDLKMVESSNPTKEMIRIIYENFSAWGEIEDINYISNKGTCFIRYSHRCSAEFAKEAMVDQSLVGEEIIRIKWAYDDPNPMSKKRIELENENRFLSAVIKKKENLKKINERNSNKAIPSTDYSKFYNEINNPYTNSNILTEEQRIINNSTKLAETLRMIDETFNDDN